MMIFLVLGCTSESVEIPEGAYACEEQPEVCAAIYKPVCGSDGETHSNACVACSKGVEWVSLGECE